MVGFDEYIVPELAGKVIFVTGGTAGLGKQTVASLAAHNPAKIYFSGRNAVRGECIVSEFKKTHPKTDFAFVSCDLASLNVVSKAAKNFTASESRLDILVANAGIMAVPPGLTEDGYEVQFGTNHLGHALLIKLLLPTLQATAKTHGDARIVLLTSLGMQIAPSVGINFETLQTPQAGFAAHWTRYGQSKLANLLYAREVARHYPTLTTASVHPGIIATELVTTMGFWDRALVTLSNAGRYLTPEQGCQNSVWAATVDKSKLASGGFYEPVGKFGTTTKSSTDDVLAAKLWTWTQEQLKVYGS